jgi:predicted AAA+ superfamily ATPase
MNYKRPLQASLLEQLSRPATVIHLMNGPRQVGKTTIARQIQDAIGIPAIYATADSPVPLDAAWVETQWRLAAAEQIASGSPVLLVLDELQEVRGWSETLKLLCTTPGTPPRLPTI